MRQPDGGPVAGVGGPAAGVLLNVVVFAPPGRDPAPGDDAGAVPAGDRTALLGGEAAFRRPQRENLPLPHQQFLDPASTGELCHGGHGDRFVDSVDPSGTTTLYQVVLVDGD